MKKKVMKKANLEENFLISYSLSAIPSGGNPTGRLIGYFKLKMLIILSIHNFKKDVDTR